MSMGYGANYADVVSEEVVKTICPEEYGQLVGLLEQQEVSLEDFARMIADDMELDGLSDDETQKLNEAFETLTSAFNKKTKNAGLTLSYHDVNNNGDCYDGINGAYWEVFNAFQLSPAGRILKAHLSRQFFVTYG